MKSPFSLWAVALLAARVSRALNDWSIPCTSGVCSYDIPDSHGSLSGTLKIWGSQDAISDITPAAGWEILNCDRNATEQDIRLICASASAPCGHLFANGGAEGKVVRLPENCGKNAFGRVAKTWIPENQSLPTRLAHLFSRINGRVPEVKALRFDTQFHAVDTDKAGAVNFAILAAAAPGPEGTPSTHPPSSNQPTRRGIGDIIKHAVAAPSALNDVKLDKSIPFDPIDADLHGTIIKESLSCPPVTSSIELDMDGKAHAQIALGVSASGTIVPPSIKDFRTLTTISADVNGTMTLRSDAGVSLDSGKITIFEVGLPGLDFPGILSIGPTFQINVQGTATLDTATSASVGINYHLDQTQVEFPPAAGHDNNVNGFGLRDTPLQLSVTPPAQATGEIQAHVIPTLNLGIKAFSAGTGVFVALDSSAVVKFTPGAVGPTVKARDEVSTGGEFKRDAVEESSAASSASPSELDQRAPDSLEPRSASTLNGCFQINSVLDFNVGADAAFFDVIKAGVKISFFQKTFQLFKKCVGTSVPVRRSAPTLLSPGHLLEERTINLSNGNLITTYAPPHRRQRLERISVLPRSLILKRAKLTCLAPTTSALVQISNQVVQASAAISI